MITQEIYRTIRELGFVEYEAHELYAYIQEHDAVSFEKLNMNAEAFQEAFNNPNSAIFQTYQYFPIIKRCGALEYDAQTIAAILLTDEAQMIELLADPTTKEHRKYKQGLLESKFKIDSALTADAETGNKDAIRLLAQRKREKEIKALKNNLFGDAKTIRELKS